MIIILYSDQLISCFRIIIINARESDFRTQFKSELHSFYSKLSDIPVSNYAKCLLLPSHLYYSIKLIVVSFPNLSPLHQVYYPSIVPCCFDKPSDASFSPNISSQVKEREPINHTPDTHPRLEAGVIPLLNEIPEPKFKGRSKAREFKHTKGNKRNVFKSIMRNIICYAKRNRDEITKNLIDIGFSSRAAYTCI